MGSEPTYRTDCYHCSYSVCRNGCDDCSSCASNMAEHRRLRRLESTFIDTAYESKKKTLDNCVSVINDLRDNYNIYIYYYSYSDTLECSKEILNKLEEKKNEIVNNFNKYEYNYDPYYSEIQLLKNEHEERIQRINNEFEINIKELENEKEIEILDLNNKITQEKKIIAKNENNKKNCNIDISIDNFKTEKSLEFEKKFQSKKLEIDSKYSFENISNPILEYTEEEKNEKNMLLNNIRAIKKYSYLPNYNILILNFELINDL